MAGELTFDNASVLSYSVQNNFLGDSSFNINSVKNISIQGYIDSRAGNTDYSGVRETFSEITTMSDNGHDYHFNDLTINGVNYGRGRITSMNFDSDASTKNNQIRLAQYSANIEIYETGDLSSMGGTYYTGLKEALQKTDSQFLQNFTESFNFSSSEDGSHKHDHTVSFNLISGHYDDEFDPRASAQKLAKEIFETTPDFGLIENEYQGYLNESGRRTHSESYDLINLNYSFTENYTTAAESQSTNYIPTFTHTIAHDEAGNVTVRENATIKGMENNAASGYIYSAIEGMNTEIDGSYGRCNQVFADFTSFGDLQGTAFHVLNTRSISLGKQFNSGVGETSYDVVYTNKQNLSGSFINEYSLTANLNNDKDVEVTENGTIRIYGTKTLNFDGYGEYQSLQNDINHRASGFHKDVKTRLGIAVEDEEPKPISSSVDYPAFGNELSYSKKFTDNARILTTGSAEDLGITSVEITTSLAASTEMHEEKMVPSRGDEGQLLHLPDQTNVGSYTIKVTATKKRHCDDHVLINPPLLKTEVATLISDYVLPEFYKLPRIISQKLNEYWIDDLSYDYDSDAGKITLTASAKYTTPNATIKYTSTN